ncbi:GAF domain protein [Coleofasciculus chthonoplastes PCC 7420]|uniref:histidine kinase n=1 Tax=Coleofasciculus chthonoplastes PCC 7420 TaxID=118168 RepID=B4VT21_9CYAN|nr:GAF domain-containing sensor histidine kinase [Coleofasciculus chthonoplastes]EDX74919.1 GAF domain protein [Coleofasciculus chthonoplastes PCC 7420]
MAELETRIYCPLNGLNSTAQDQKRLATLQELGLLEAEGIAVFQEATQTAVRFLEVPIGWLGFLTTDQLLIQSAVGLSRVGLMNPLAQSRQLHRQESFCTYVVESQQVLAIQDTASNPVFAQSLLVGYYGIRAYLGAPLFTADGLCLGTLAVMDLVPRSFTPRDIEFLAMTARWCLSEFERNYQLRSHASILPDFPQASASLTPNESNFTQGMVSESSVPFSSTHSIKLQLLTHLTQELRTPLTSIMGMASVLNRQIYGELTDKQKEYLEIIHQSGQHLVSLVEEIMALDVFDEINNPPYLNLSPVDIEMLCQKAIHSLVETAEQNQQQIRLTIEPGTRLWLLDKEKVQQMLYYVILSVIYSAEAGGEIRLHVSRKIDTLNMAVWVSHPWLGEGVPTVYEELTDVSLTGRDSEKPKQNGEAAFPVSSTLKKPVISSVSMSKTLMVNGKEMLLKTDSRESLGLFLSCHLAELHHGKLAVQGLSESGDRYIISLPKLDL